MIFKYEYKTKIFYENANHSMPNLIILYYSSVLQLIAKKMYHDKVNFIYIIADNKNH